MSRYGLALQERRELQGFRTQSDLARSVRALHDDGRLPGDLRPFSQQWLSSLEDDRTGEVIARARPQMIRALAYMLRWTAAEFEEHVGVGIGPVPGFDAPKGQAAADTSAAARGWAVPPQAPRPIGDTLREAAELFGGHSQFAGLREYRWQRFLEDLNYKRRPQTPEEWLTVFIDLKDRFDPPEADGSTDR